MVSSQAAALFSTTIQGILYGFSTFMFSLAVWFMLRDRSTRQINYYVIGAGCALFVLSTAEMAVNIGRVYQGFISRGPYLERGPDAFFADASEPTFVAKGVLFNAQTLILDAVVIFRAYVVWQRFLIVVMPILSWCALLGGYIGLNISLATGSPEKDDTLIFVTRTGRWITATYALTLTTNLSASILLALKIWAVARRSAHYRYGDFFSPVVRVIIESGAIYSMAIIASLITFVTKSNGHYVTLDMLSPIISIVFNMLIIRLRLTNELNAPISAAWSTYLSTLRAAAEPDRGHDAMPRRPCDVAFQMTDWKVEITRVVEDDSEYGLRDATVGPETESAPSIHPTSNRKAKLLDA